MNFSRRQFIASTASLAAAGLTAMQAPPAKRVASINTVCTMMERRAPEDGA